MTVTIGRVSLSTGLNEWNMGGGDRISCTTDIQSTSVEAAKALRAQVLGLANNPDEPYVPVTFTEDSDLDGYYTVEDCEVSTTPVSLVAFTFGVSISLRRVPNYSLPEAQSVVLGATRSNEQTVTSAAQYSAYWAAQPPATQYYLGGAATSRVADTGTVSLFHQSSANGVGAKLSQYSTVPVDWYDGAAVVEVSRNSVWYTVVGRQIHTGTAAVGWRISNGLIRVTAHATEGFAIAAYDGSWGTAKQIIIDKTSGTASAFTTFAVLRNSPEEVAVRVGYVGGAQGTEVSNGYIDIRIRRGARCAEFVAVFPSAVSTFGAVFRGTNEAGTNMAIGGTVVGVRANADDADGNRYYLVAAQTVTTDTTIGKITVTTETPFPFAFGFQVTTGNSETCEEQASQYFFPYTERVTLVGR